MSFSDLLQWWNLIYALPFAFSLVWLLGLALSGGGHEHSGHALEHHLEGLAGHLHAGVGHGHLGHIAGHAHAEAGEVHGHAGGAHEGHVHGGHAEHEINQPSWMDRMLGLLGLGRTPLSILLGTLCLCWGSLGLLTNRLLGVNRVPGMLTILPSLAVTAVVTLVATRIVAEIVGRLMPTTESYAVSHAQLVGCLGTAVYAVSETGGTIQVRDGYGTLHRAMALTAPGATPIPAGAPVLVVALDNASGRYVVEPSSL